MKITICLFTIVIIPFAFGEEIPRDYAELRKMREDKILELNMRYVENLEKLKLKYTKAGNLDIAVKIDEEIKGFSLSKDSDGGKLLSTQENPSEYVMHGPYIKGNKGDISVIKIIKEGDSYVYLAKDGEHVKVVKRKVDGSSQLAYFYVGEVSEYGRKALTQQRDAFGYLIKKK